MSCSGRLLLRLAPGAQGYIPAGCILSLSAGFQTNTVKQHRQRCVSKYKKDQTYMWTVKKNLHSSLSMGILQSQPTMWLAPIWLDSSVGRALHPYRRSHGLEFCWNLNFFSGFKFKNWLSCAYIWKMSILHCLQVYCKLTMWSASS